jgi:hypothetical protein
VLSSAAYRHSAPTHPPVTAISATHRITTQEQLDALYGEPVPRSLIKELEHISPHYRAFIEAAPFVVVATSGPEDLVGLGRMALAYPELPADVLAGRPLARTRICRTFSDCTTGPRHQMVSGCFPLDPFYKTRPEAGRIKALKRPAGKPNDRA